MNRILKIGMDVHKETYTLCAIEVKIDGMDKQFPIITVPADYHMVIKFIDSLKKRLGNNSNDTYNIVCGYEAGCLGYSLYRELTNAGINCVILAPTTMLSPQGKRVKNDKRDALIIAQCLVHNTYRPVHVPTEEDEAVQGYIRMQEDCKHAIKRLKNQIKSFCLRLGYKYHKSKSSYWGAEFLKWLRDLELPPLSRETLDEYLAQYSALDAAIEQQNKKINELAKTEPYAKDVKKLVCLLGIKEHTALTLIVETGDFSRFPNARTYASYLGLCPGERSSGEKVCRTSITKAGNMHLRTLLIEASQGICRGTIGYKSKTLRARQEGAPIEVISYADRGNIRLRKRYHKLIHAGKKHNIAVTVVAKELAGFVWGIMTDHIYGKPEQQTN